VASPPLLATGNTTKADKAQQDRKGEDRHVKASIKIWQDIFAPERLMHLQPQNCAGNPFYWIGKSRKYITLIGYRWTAGRRELPG
jgi:hypothetical protein